MIKKNIPIMLAFIVFIICLVILFLGDNIGLSDNGDYARIIENNDIRYIQKENNNYIFRDKYAMKVEGENFFKQIVSLFKSTDGVEYVTPHHHIIKLSKLLNYFNNLIFRKNIDNYNIFFLAIIYISLFTLSSFYIISAFDNNKYRIISFILILFFFCDAGYILYFNSFYGEALQYVCVMLILGIILQLINNKFSYFKLILLFITIYYFGGSKLVNIPLAIILVISTLIFLLNRKDLKFKIVLISMIILTTTSLVVLYMQVPKWMSDVTNYQAVFFGILKQSDSVNQDLERLKLPNEYKVLANTNAYMSEYEIDIHSDEFKSEFHNNISKGKILKYYLLNPVKLMQKLCLSIENSCNIRPAYLGNDTQILSYQTNRWSMWSNLRLFSNFLYEPIFVILILVGLGIYCLYKCIYKRDKDKILPTFYLLILLLGIVINLVLPIICNGEADLAKHMFLFTNLVDILFVIGIFKLIINFDKIYKNRKMLICSILSIIILIIYIIVCNYTPMKTMYFGTYKGEKIKWDILEEKENNVVRLISHDSIAKLPFDDNSNLWKTSTIRLWLNSEFLQEFSKEEINLIQDTNQNIILSNENINLKEKGNHPHFYTYIKKRSNDLKNTAYSYNSMDIVSLPTFEDIKKINNPKKEIWTIEPYTSNGFMIRTYTKNGLVLKQDVKSKLDIRPIIEIKINN